MNLLKRTYLLILSISMLSILTMCTSMETEQESSDEIEIAFDKYELDNGLDVILHEDHSDPIVSMTILYHVGSNREVPGRTGFAHLFEHMLFQESENVGQDQFFKTIQDAGGTLNGGTWQDGTIYYEVVPKNAMELIMWLESDRMGFFINTVTESAFVNQQEVVQNEKRQGVDNRPYGHTSYVIDKALYPEGHPYNWQVIGELEDLQNATVEDVKEFYRNFYGPNNATLVLAGDFEPEEAKTLIEKYFGEIKRSREVVPMEPQPASLESTIKLYHEDNFATASQLNMVWPSVEEFHPDSYALNYLAQILSDGKTAPLYNVLVEERKLTSDTRAFNQTYELAGKFRISITANEEKSLDDIEKAVFEAFQRFEEKGITDTDIERVKASQEREFYNTLNSVLFKSFQLAQWNTFTGDPAYYKKDIEMIKSVTREDVQRVYEKYIKDKPYLVTSFVPKDETDYIVANSEVASVKEEEIEQNVEKEIADTDVEIEKTPSEFDRSVKPEQGTPPGLNIPETWTAELSNGLKIYGIENSELPLIEMSLVIDGGQLADDISKVGVANLMTDIMMEGTATKTPKELEEEIDLLGSAISMYTSTEEITIRANTLSRNFEKTFDLVEEILLEPRWDTTEFARIKTSTENLILRRSADPNVIAQNTFNKVLYGEDNIRAYSSYGDQESLNSITIDDLKEFYSNFFSPNIARFHIAGNISKDEVLSVLSDLEDRWSSHDVTLPEYSLPDQDDANSLYFVDIPDAKQSVIRIGYLALKRTDPDYYATEVMNYKLGGSFSGNINMVLREEKGYTYGARSYFSGTKEVGPFVASSSVRTNVTYESVEIFMDEMNKYREGISEEDLEFTKNAMIKSNARRFETLYAKMGMLSEMSKYNLPPDYVKQEEEVIRNMTLEQHKALAEKYVDPTKMTYVVSGDAKTQFSKLKDAGFDKVVLLDKDGNPMEAPETIDVLR